ncbi:E3 ubiquitin ligase family protein [Rubrobacter indicoceani]|uniref:E3 ubiquitin ligase family protein n=1 Tax=Rubrobacter indicoceani TaxID=2051957 RepID=UPI000E5AD5E4|nr:E3 ubiquitin ligase family protein [Rubrobacter indicoceani]
MLFGGVFVLVGVVIVIAAVVVLYFRRRTLGKTDLMRKTETLDAASVGSAAPGTLVEVKGTLRCGEPVTAELSGEVCAYALTKVVREYEDVDRDADGDRRVTRRSETLAENEEIAPFFIEDGSGEVEVNARGAEVDAEQVVNRFERDPGEGGLSLGGIRIDLGGGGDRTLGYRHTESILRPDSPVYVLGTVGADGVVQAAGDNTKEQTFIVSHRSEEQLEKGYRKEAMILGFVAAGLFVFGLVFVAVGVGAAFLGA